MTKAIIYILTLMLLCSFASADIFFDEDIIFGSIYSNITYVSSEFNATHLNMTNGCLGIGGGTYAQDGCFSSGSTITMYVKDYNITEDTTTFSTQPNTLAIDINHSSNVTSQTANLVYNGTAYAVTKVSNTGYDSFYVTLTTPLVSSDTTLSYYWNITETLTDLTTQTYRINRNQTVYRSFAFGNCTELDDVTLTMNIFNEQSVAQSLNATVEVTIDTWITDPDNSMNYSTEFSGNSSYNLCMNWTGTPIYGDAYIKYTTDDGFTHRFFMVNQSFSNETITANMYNFNTTIGISDLKATVRNKDSFSYFENVIVSLQRLYPAENVWRTVQMDETGDFGLTFFNIEEEDTDYRFLFRDRSNNVLETTERLKFICTAGVCDLTFLVDEYSASSDTSDLQISHSFNNLTGNITVTWNDPTALTSSVVINVTKQTYGNPLTICADSFIGATSGTYDCDISAFINNTVRLDVSATASPLSKKLTAWYEPAGRFVNYLGIVETGFWSFIIMLAIIGLGMITPATLPVSIVAGLVLLMYLGIAPSLSITAVIIAGALGLIISFKVRD